MIPVSRLVYRLLLAVDIERYSRRSAREQLRVQHDLDTVLRSAAAHADLDRDGWHRQARGDGELAVLAGKTDIAHAVGALTQGLEDALAALNRGRPHHGRLRVRVAFHYGTLSPGPFGPAGDAPIVVSRLLDAAPVRRVLAERRDRDLALVVSDSLYEDVVRTGFCVLDALGFEPMRTSVKGIGYRGLVYSGGGRTPASVPSPAESCDAVVLALVPAANGTPRT